MSAAATIALSTLIRRQPTCWYCDCRLTLERGRGDTISRDHTIPASQGGRRIVAACFRCNWLKADMTSAAFFDAYPDADAIEAALPMGDAHGHASNCWRGQLAGDPGQARERVVLRRGLTDPERRRRAEAFARYWLGVERRRRAVKILVTAFARYLEGADDARATAD